jgi:hypothetical protein
MTIRLETHAIGSPVFFSREQLGFNNTVPCVEQLVPASMGTVNLIAD